MGRCPQDNNRFNNSHRDCVERYPHDNNIYTLYLYRYIFLHQYCKNNKIDISIFLHFLKDYTKCSQITNLRRIYHPERRDYDVAKMGSKTGAGKT